MKRLLLLLVIGTSQIHAMTPIKEIALENDILWAIKTGDLAKAKTAVADGAPLNEIKYLIGYIGTYPLANAVALGKYSIADFLISKGADTQVLNRFLLPEALSGNTERVKWLLAHGVKDINNEVLNELREYEKDEVPGSLKSQYAEIIKLLERVKANSPTRPEQKKNQNILEELETEEFLPKPGQASPERRKAIFDVLETEEFLGA